LNELALFAGAGGGILGGKLLGWRTVCAVEIDPYAASVLVARQNDGCLEPFPIWDDVRTFDGKEWRGRVDVISGGFPCQDVSPAGSGKGVRDGKKSGSWGEFARIICEVKPKKVFVENAAILTSRGLDRVLWDLASLGYAARWGVFSAEEVGAEHRRERMFLVADSDGFMGEAGAGLVKQSKEPAIQPRNCKGNACNCFRDWMEMAKSLVGTDDGVAGYVDAVRCIGNGQFPEVAKLAWETLNLT